MLLSVNGMLHFSKNFSQPICSAHSPTRSYFLASLAYTSRIFLTASTTSGQRGGLLGRNGITSLENFGADLELDILPPTRMAIPSPSGSARGIEGHMV